MLNAHTFSSREVGEQRARRSTKLSIQDAERHLRCGRAPAGFDARSAPRRVGSGRCATAGAGDALAAAADWRPQRDCRNLDKTAESEGSMAGKP
jgi:hypothetical protein